MGLDADRGQLRQIRILNRVITWEARGVTWESNPRHAGILLEQMGLVDAKPLKVPGAKPTKEKDDSQNQKCETEGDQIDKGSQELLEKECW